MQSMTTSSEQKGDIKILWDFLHDEAFTSEEIGVVRDLLDKTGIRKLSVLDRYNYQEMVEIGISVPICKTIQYFLKTCNELMEQQVSQSTMKTPIFSSTKKQTKEEVEIDFQQKELHWNTVIQKCNFEVKFFPEKGQYYCPIRDNFFVLPPNAKTVCTIDNLLCS